MATPRVLPIHSDSVIAYCDANPDFAIGVAEGVVMMVPYDAQDSSQQWRRYIPAETDQQKQPSYYFVNNRTDEVLTSGHGNVATYLSARPFKGANINPDNMLWTPAENINDSYGSIAATETPSLNITVAGDVEKGSRLIVAPWGNARNQRWKLIPLPHN